MTSQFGPTGVTLDRYDDILARLITLAHGQWGKGINTEKDGFLGHVIRNKSLISSETNEVVQSIYDAMSVANATGAPLDGLVGIMGLFRQSEAFSITVLTLTALKATSVPVGSMYASDTGIIFATDEQLVFPPSDSFPSERTVESTCTAVGANSADAGDINIIKTPVYAISACTNADDVIPGRIRETDAELKGRHTDAVATSGEDDASSIFEAVSAVSGVSAVYFHDNDTNDEAEGVPSKNIHVSVIGGSDEDVATAISNNKTSGVPTHGSQNYTVYNEETSQAKVINFDRADEVPIHIAVEITKVVGVFPSDGEAQIKDALVASFASQRIKQTVNYLGLNAPIYSVPGLNVTGLEVDIVSPPTGTSNIPMTALEKATLIADNVAITDTP